MPPRRESVLRDSGTPSRDAGHKVSNARRSKHHNQHTNKTKAEKCVQSLERENMGVQVGLPPHGMHHETSEPLKEMRQAETQTDADSDEKLADSIDISQTLMVLDRDDSFMNDAELDRLAAALVAAREETRRLILAQLDTGSTLRNMLKQMVMANGGETQQQEGSDDILGHEGVMCITHDQSGSNVDQQHSGDCIAEQQDSSDPNQQQGYTGMEQELCSFGIGKQQSEGNADILQDVDVNGQQQDGDASAHRQSGATGFACSADAPGMLLNA